MVQQEDSCNLILGLLILTFVVAVIYYSIKKMRKMPQWDDLPLGSKAKDCRDYLIVKRESYFKSSRLWKVV
jgi:uncharacterized membrane protein